MVSMSGAMGAGSASNYFEKDNYYINGNEEKGRWFGEGAETLGKEGTVSMSDFRSIEHGFAPGTLSEKQLDKLDAFGAQERSLAHEAQQIKGMEEGPDKVAAQAAFEERRTSHNQDRSEFTESLSNQGKEQLVRNGYDGDNIQSHRAGYDMTFSAPKSVSVAGLVLGDKDVIKAHQDAVNTAMKYVEANFAQTRIYDENGDRMRVNTGNLVVSQFDHFTSRSVDGQAPDPQLHTHNFIANMTEYNGKMMSLDPNQIYKNMKAADQLYMNELGKSLEKMGYQTEWVKTGENYSLEIKGMSKELSDHFSKRDAQIGDHLAIKEAELGRKLTAEEKSVLKLETRDGKEVHDMNKLEADWKTQMAEKGIDRDTLQSDLKSQQADFRSVDTVAGALNSAAEVLGNKQAVFSKHDIMFEAAKASQGQFSTKELEQGMKDMKTDLVSLDRTRNDNSAELYSTKANVAAEADVFKSVQDGKDVMQAVSTKEEFAGLTNERESFAKLTEGQRSAVEMIMTSQDRITAVQGDAGTGKTTMLRELNELSGNKLEIVGLAATGKAAAEIQNATGIESQTIDRFLLTADKSQIDQSNRLYVIDEASLMSTKKLAETLSTIEGQGARVVMVGDTKQLKAVGEGDLFSKLQEGSHLNVAEMTQGLRQKTEMTKDVVESFKSSDGVVDGLNRLQQEGRVVESDLSTAKASLTENFVQDAQKYSLNDTVALVSTNAEKSELNASIRSSLQEAGIVGKESVNFATLESKSMNEFDAKQVQNYEKGDILVSTQMNGNIKAGMETKVLDIDRENGQMLVGFVDANGDSKECWITGEEAAERFGAFSEKSTEIAMDEKITFTKNDNTLGVKNGETGIVESISKNGDMSIRIGDDKDARYVEMNGYESRNFDHGYALTTYKSQGQSVDQVHILADSNSNMNNLNAGYVQMSRAKEDIHIYTDNLSALAEKYEQSQVKENVSDYREIGDLDNIGKEKSFDEKIEAVLSNDQNAEKDLSNNNEPKNDQDGLLGSDASTSITSKDESFDSKLESMMPEASNSNENKEPSFEEKIDELISKVEEKESQNTEKSSEEIKQSNEEEKKEAAEQSSGETKEEKEEEISSTTSSK